MTDTSQFPLPLEHRLTQDMMYGLKPSALQSRSTRTSVAPLNGSTFTPGISLVNAQIPYSFTQINKTNNVFYVSGTSYTIPVGNYNIYTLITALLAILPSGFNITINTLTNI
jgi:hypothetical protein